ncbi:hypothetical protein ACRRTK_007336 [Alexandromys fortis]
MTDDWKYNLSIVAVNERIDNSIFGQRRFISSNSPSWISDCSSKRRAAEMIKGRNCKVLCFLIVCGIFKNRLPFPSPKNPTYGDAYRNYFRLQMACTTLISVSKCVY